MKARIAVIGGGITGAFAAYFLGRCGAAVTLIERDEIGGQWDYSLLERELLAERP